MKHILLTAILPLFLFSCTNDSNLGGADSQYYSEPIATGNLSEGATVPHHRQHKTSSDSTITTHKNNNSNLDSGINNATEPSANAVSPGHQQNESGN